MFVIQCAWLCAGFPKNVKLSEHSSHRVPLLRHGVAGLLMARNVLSLAHLSRRVLKEFTSVNIS